MAVTVSCTEPEQRPRAGVQDAAAVETAEASAPASRAQAPDATVFQPALFRRYPAMQDRLPRAAIGSFPTPIERAVRLGAHLGIEQLYLKRDDRSDPSFGGSKTRKLAFLLGAARELGRSTLVTFGSVGSNHALATALFGTRAGFRVTLMLMPEPPWCGVEQFLLVEHELGATLQLFPSTSQAMRAADRLAHDATQADSVYVIPPGGSSPVGNIGYVDAAYELHEQVAAGLLPEPDYVYVAAGTLGTAVGLALGFKAAGMKTRVVPVRASSLAASSEARMIAAFDETLAHLRSVEAGFPAVELRRGESGLRHGYLGKGYALPTEQGRRAMRLAMDLAELRLEPTYTAKAFAALLDDAPKLAGKVVVFWATHSEVKPMPTRATVKELPAVFRPYGCGAQGR